MIGALVDGVDLVRGIFPAFAMEDMPEFDKSVVIYVGDDAVCHVGMTVQTIEVGGLLVRIGAIGYVATAIPWRNRGLMTAAVGIALQKATDEGCRYALLSTSHVGLYEPLGFRRASNLDQESMVCDLTEKHPWPEESRVVLVNGGKW